MSSDELLSALDWLKRGHLKPGPDMEEAHEICQQHEGTPSYDWIHALVHRIEGDDANAGYWYRRAGRSRHAGSIEDEWKIVRTVIENG